MDEAFHAPGFNTEATVATLLNTSGIALFGVSVLMADAATSAPQNEVEKWIGPLTTSLTSLLGSVFAFLTARELSRNDADKRIQKADLDRAIKDNAECKEDRAVLHAELGKANRKINRLMRKMGVSAEDDDEEDATDRRGEHDPDYEGPRRRKGDTDSKFHKPLPPNPEPPK